ncbi:conserved protein of unknown function [Tenacibaculum sp. 190524A02b]|uniref:hypothetical protein n=1 Tax=Tenacibaculum vairaonense TaxID=3137860 RepID=UPI0032B104BD
MENTQELNNNSLLNAILNQELIVVRKSDLKELISEMLMSNRVDHRVKYASHKEVIKMFGVTDYWLKQQRSDPDTKLICNPGRCNNSSWKYQIQSVQDELDRLAV